MKTPWSLIVCFCLFLLSVNGLVYAESNIPSDVQNRLKIIYGEMDQLFSSCSKAYREVPRESIPLEFDILPASFEPQKYSIFGKLSVQVWAQSLQLEGAYNYALAQELEESSSSKKVQPSLKAEEAVSLAKDYLQKFGIKVPGNVTVTTVEFDGHYSSSWEIRWTRCVDGYEWDDFNPAELESVHVIFHEKLGIIGIGNNIVSPLPKTLEVKLSREQAMAKAENYVGLVERTPFYRQARKDGFAANGVKSCELKIAAPNWLLDPKRAIWIREKPPEETRLCWVVSFSTIDTKADERGLKNKDGKPLKLIPPDILIYLDAATGECVGSNFS